MAARFDINHINLVGYLTDESSRRVPRTDRETLGTFLMSLAYNGNLISSTQGTPEDWTRDVADAANRQLHLMGFQFGSPKNLEPINPRHYLDPLRPYFTGYDFYALILPVDEWTLDRQSLQFFMEAGISSGRNGLVLLPNQKSGEGLSQFVDPFPALQELARQPVGPPGVLFWTKLGSACALGMNDAFRFLRHDLLDALAGGPRATDQAISRQASRQTTKRILHLSDLHIGLEEATFRRSYLKRHLRGLLPTIDRVAVTGDLFDTPKEGFRASFDEFRRDIEESMSKRLLVVPGNHDVRFRGNALGPLGRTADYVTDLDWSPLEIDDEMQAVFYSFNSSEGSNFARGCVSKRQRRDRAERYDEAVVRREHIRAYSKIALVHHHPVDYGSQPTAFYERILARFGGDDRFIAFEESQEFLKWCFSRDVGLILHGHKHIPHLSTVRAKAAGGAKEVTIVGCGSSVGVEGKPMCYDIVSINPATQRWSVSFHHDERGDGSGFELQNVAIDLRTPI